MRKRPLLTRESKERKVIELYEKGTNIRQIAKRVHLSFGDIGVITRKHSGDEDVSQNTKKLSKHSLALELFRTNHSNLEVAIRVGLTDSETEEEQKQYRRLINMDRFCQFFDAMKGDLEYHLQLYSELRNANLTIHQAIEGVRYAQSIASMKLECDNLQNKRREIMIQSFEIWKRMQVLKQEEHDILNYLERVKGVVNPAGNQGNFPELNNDTSFTTPRRRRRRTRTSFDDFKTDIPSS